ncbi:hypothetical protein C9J21_20395 [Photobacterium phosphoreum]|uniref:hypothetical protein n=1 Tax=Photobacterium phosphoreum TaxID=659 RepID=UPI000D17291D|nr:hypothetical protein [Photobacterium phosphoreum]PSW28710.1 hypothetical protein C9J21_20395 [Photobacterium phosphoreum]
MNTNSSTVITTSIIPTSAFSECPTFAKIKLSYDDIEALYQHYQYILSNPKNDDFYKFSLVSDENFGWSKALNINEFRTEQYLHPDLLNCIVSSKGLKFAGAYLDDQNQEIDTFKTMLIDLNELINKPKSITLM